MNETQAMRGSRETKKSGGRGSGVRNLRFKRDGGMDFCGAGVSARTAYLTAFFGIVFILACILILSGVYPFGTECFLRTDMYHQYAPFFSELREKLQSGGSLLYSWDIGLGVNFTALYAYYLASPLNWLIVFCPAAHVIEFMTIMVVLKLGLCGTAMTWYLRDRFQTRSLAAACFGIFYGLSGYLAAYYWNVMWLDCILLFPLITRGLERLIEEKRGILYAASLGLCILSNYYISIMICLFLILYFIAENVLHAPENAAAFFGRCLRFACFSLLAGGMAAVLLLPEIAALTQTASADVSFPKSVTQYFTVLDMAARHLIGVETEQGLDHWPNIYCGVAALPLFGLYLSSARIRLKEKAVYVLLLLFFLMSFSLNVLNFIWHGFHYPNSLPARQSFIYIFLVLFISFRAYLTLPHISARSLGTAFLASAAFVLLCQKLITARHFAFWVYYLSLLFLAAYMLLLWLMRTGRIRRTGAALAAISLVLVEAAANTGLTSVTTTSRTSYTDDNEDVRALTDTLFPSTEFFRVEKINRKTKNDGAWLNFPSVSLFSSMANADCTDFFRALGCEASTNAYSITGSTPLVNMLFSVRYGLYGGPQTDGEEKTFVDSSGETYLYRNNLSLPLGFALPERVLGGWAQDLDNPALVQDALCDMLGTDAVLIPNEVLPSENGADLAATAGADGEYYAFVTNPQVKKVSVSTPLLTKTFENTDRGYLLELGSCSAGDLIEMKSETADQAMQAQIYRFDYGALRQVYDRLSEFPLKLSVWEDDRLSGSITVDSRALGYGEDAATVFLSIPYDEGWQLLVDGREAETVKVFDTFLGLQLETGTHEIALRFMPKGLVPGLFILGASLALLLIIALFSALRRRRAARRRSHSDEAYEPEMDGYELEADGYEPEAEEYELGAEQDGAAEQDRQAGGKEQHEESGGLRRSLSSKTRGAVKAPQAAEKPGIDEELRAAFDLGRSRQDMLEHLSRMQDRDAEAGDAGIKDGAAIHGGAAGAETGGAESAVGKAVNDGASNAGAAEAEAREDRRPEAPPQLGDEEFQRLLESLEKPKGGRI